MGKYLDTENQEVAVTKQRISLAHFRGYYPSRRMSGNVRTIYGFSEDSWIFLDQILVPENFSDEHTRRRAKITVEVDKYLKERFENEKLALDQVDNSIDQAAPFSGGPSSINPLDWIKLYNLTAPIYRHLLEEGIEELALISP